ncbi:MAG: glycosyltransferase family 39 protein [Planctomycetota bacterium]
MSSVHADTLFSSSLPSRTDRLTWIALAIILFIAAFLRLNHLGDRSLWHDEFATWHVSRMPLADSLRWGPELTKPPLYQLLLRVITPDPHPSETMLRLPAAISGLLYVWAVWWMARTFAGTKIALALATILAFQPLHIDYSQEARPYTMLSLGATVATTLWYRIVAKPRLYDIVAYVVTAALTFHAHYLFGLTLVSHALWWLITHLFRHPLQTQSIFPTENSEKRAYSSGEGSLNKDHPKCKEASRLYCHHLAPVFVLFIIGLLCLPQVLHYLVVKTAVFQGLDWIEPPNVSRVLATLERLTFHIRPAGVIWILGLLVPSLVWILIGPFRGVAAHVPPLSSSASGGTAMPRLGSVLGRRSGHRPETLLACWLLCSFGGLLLISWIAQPALVDRYALPATIPALLLPLLMIQRLGHRVAVAIAAIFLLAAIPESLFRNNQPHLGFRELSIFLNDRVDPKREAVVLAIDGTADQEWSDLERLAFRYYPLEGQPVHELPIRHEPDTSNPILQDPRALYVVAFRADPIPTLQAAGRQIEPFEVEGTNYSQLLFAPYRLMRIAGR